MALPAARGRRELIERDSRISRAGIAVGRIGGDLWTDRDDPLFSAWDTPVALIALAG